MYSDRYTIIENKIKEVKFKVDELKDKYKCIIIPLMIYFNEEYIIGYVKEPNRYQKSLSLSKMAKSVHYAGLELLEHCLLKEYSNEKLYSNDYINDYIVLSASKKVMEHIVIMSQNTHNIISNAKQMINNSGDAQIAALIKYQFKLDPDTMTDNEFYRNWAQIEWLMKKGITDGKFK